MPHLKIYDPHKNHYHLQSFQLLVLPPALLLSPLMSNANTKWLMQNWHDEPCYSTSFKRRDCSWKPQKFSNSSTQTGDQAGLQQALRQSKENVCLDRTLWFVNDSTLLHQSMLGKQKHGKCKARSTWIKNSNREIQLYLNWPFMQQHAHGFSTNELKTEQINCCVIP